MIQKLKWYIDRLALMSGDEVMQRFRSVYLKKTQEKAFARLPKFSEMKLREAPFPQLPDREKCHPEIKQSITDEANAIIQGEWHVLRGMNWEVTCPVDWTRDYSSGKKVESRESAHSINHRDIEGFDSRASWEPSRFIQAVRVAQSAWLNHDPIQAKWVIDLITDWNQQNPVGVGIQWTSPMEAALRLINLSWIDALLQGLPLPQDLLKQWTSTLAEIIPPHTWWVWRYKSFGSSANNHLLGELAGLTLVNNRWEALEHFSTSREKLKNIVQKETILQFHSDGGNKEEALHYHHFAWEMLWQSHLSFLQATGTGLNSACVKRLKNGARFFSDLVSTKEPWDFGDSDDAHITPFYQNEKNAISEWVEYFNGKHGAPSYWMGKFQPIEEQLNIQGFQVYPDSGYAVFKNETFKLRIDSSQLGMGKMAAHGHLDALHISMWDGEDAVLIDPGTGGYFGYDEERMSLASKESHNGPIFNNDDFYPRRAGLFMWKVNHDKPTCDALDNTLSLKFALSQKHCVHRKIQVSNEEVKIQDRWEGDVNDRFQQNWICSPDWSIKEEEQGYLLTKGYKSWKMTILGVVASKVEKRACSPSYGKFQETLGVSLNGKIEKDHAQVTVILKKVS